MPSGAALPKTCEGHKPRAKRKGRMIAVMCAECGEAAVKGYFTGKMAREVCEAWECKRCPTGGQLVPVQPDDCAELTPHLVSDHRVFQEATADEYRNVSIEAAPDDLCTGCGWRKPEAGNPEYWHCPKCQRVNSYLPDGTRVSERAPFGSVEWERAMGMRLDRQEAKPKRRKAAIRVAPSVVDDIPF